METKCRMCHIGIDKGACNQQYTRITVVTDSDAEGTREKRSYLCEGCSASLELWMLEKEKLIQ